MTLLQAILLGIVQGLTEFIPISSTAHLVLASRVMNLALTPEQLTSSIAVIQLGTLVAVVMYFAGDIWNITRAFIHDHFMLLKNGRRDQFNRTNANARLSHEAWLGWLIIIGSLPVAIGFAQCLALIPGSSRSGSTIMAGLFAGEMRETAARFSFLLSMPAIAASGLLELKEALHRLPQGSLTTLAVGTIVSAVIGYASIWFLLRFLRTHTTGVFIVYRLLVGGAILIMLINGRISPL